MQPCTPLYERYLNPSSPITICYEWLYKLGVAIIIKKIKLWKISRRGIIIIINETSPFLVNRSQGPFHIPEKYKQSQGCSVKDKEEICLHQDVDFIRNRFLIKINIESAWIWQSWRLGSTIQSIRLYHASAEGPSEPISNEDVIPV